jgi:hypothetical protein
MRINLDHLVFATDDLSRGENLLAERLGIAFVGGGKHEHMGTHNRVVRLQSGCYLELIAIDPTAPTPFQPRWFDLDTPQLQAQLKGFPKIVHWVARVEQAPLDLTHFADEWKIALGKPTAMQRGSLQWEITLPSDGKRPAGGALPYVIAWHSEPAPPFALPESHLHLHALHITTPNPQAVQQALQGHLAPSIEMVFHTGETRLQALVETPQGQKWL